MIEIVFQQRGVYGHILLNRPKALNALTLSMGLGLKSQLDAWASDDSIKAVIVEGAGEKGFCAGGDIRWLYDTGREDPAKAADFFRNEYIADAAVKHFPKPYLAFIDGITMGGGVGISVHCSHRIAGDRTLFAMPETGIGLFPDVGGSYFLPRLPGKLGIYLGLTGARLKAADCLYAGIATHYIPSDQQAGVIETLCAGDGALAHIEETLGQATLAAPIAEQMEDINHLFGGESVDAIVGALVADGSDWAQKQVSILQSKSPTSLKITFEQLRRGATLDFDDAMKMEMRLAARIMEGHDFYEGVRAVIIEKDGAPAWSPASLAEIKDADIAAYFEDLAELELHF